MSSEVFRKIRIKGVETNYSISNLGNVRNDISDENLKSAMTGYHTIYICGKNLRVHRLVSEAFIENPLDYSQVNHKNGIRSDNRVENLEWLSPALNIQHSRDVLKRKYFTKSKGGQKFIQEVANRPKKNKINKGISSWSIGDKKYRVTLSKDHKVKTIGYTYNFQDAVVMYLLSHLEHHKTLPQCDYVDPVSKKVIFNGSVLSEARK